MAWDSGTYRRDASKANRGKPFEDFINFATIKGQYATENFSEYSHPLKETYFNK